MRVCSDDPDISNKIVMPSIIDKLIPYQIRHYVANLLLPLILGLLIGKIFLGFPIYSVVVVCLLPLLFLLRSKPEIGILAIVILLSSIVFEHALPLIPIGVGSFHLADALLLSLLFMIPLSLVLDKKFRLTKTPLDKPLLLFYLAVIISACLAIFYYNLDFNRTLRMLRVLTYYLLFFVVTNLIREETQVRFLVKGLFYIGALVGIVMLVQAMVGESVKLMPGRVETAGVFDMTFEATRVLPPGQTLVYVLFMTSVCLIALVEKVGMKPWHYFLAFSTGSGVILTYNRTYWVACILCFTVFVLLANARARKRFVGASLIALLIITALISTLLLLNPRGPIGNAVTSVSARFTSLFRGKELYESRSLEHRAVENKYAVQQIIKNPILGIGLGNEYRPAVYELKETLTYYIHNGYLWILVKTGLIGFVPLLWFFLGFVIRGLRNCKDIRDHYLRGLLTGFMLSGAGVILINITIPMFMQKFSIVVLSIVAGLTETIIRINEAEPQGRQVA